MKNLIQTSITGIFILLCLHSYAWESWTQDKTGIYSIGLGGTQGIGIPNSNWNLPGANTPPGLSLNVSGEYRVHKYISVGWETGINFYFNVNRYYLGYDYDYYAPYDGYINNGTHGIEIPLIVKGNFHFLELTKLKIRNKLDVYGGLSFGGGPGFVYGFDWRGISTRYKSFGVIHVGPQAGVRYWVTKQIGVFAELGWGATFLNAGISF